MVFSNSVYLPLIISMLLGWFAQWRVHQIYFRYGRIPNKRKIKGMEIAKILLAYHRLNIPILKTKKPMLNYYHPQTKTLHLYEQVSENNSITSMGIVAHEIEHAVQDDQGSHFMSFRNKIARLLAAMGQISPLVFLGGILFRSMFFIYLGMILLFGMVVYAMVSLPIELNASNRAVKTLKETGIADQGEIEMVSVVLRHAAFTYFAGAAQRIGTFLFVVMVMFALHQM